MNLSCFRIQNLVIKAVANSLKVTIIAMKFILPSLLSLNEVPFED